MFHASMSMLMLGSCSCVAHMRSDLGATQFLIPSSSEAAQCQGRQRVSGEFPVSALPLKLNPSSPPLVPRPAVHRIAQTCPSSLVLWATIYAA